MAKRLQIELVIFGAMLLLGLPVEAAPPAEPDGSAGVRVNVAIDTSLLDSAVGARLEPEIAEQLGPVLEAADMHVVVPPEVGDENLSIRVRAFDEEQHNYEVDLLLGSDGGVVTLVTVTCDACNERRLIEKLVEETPKLVAMHEEKLAEGNTVLAEQPLEVPRPVPEVPRRLVGPLGGTGGAMIGVGVMALVAGSYLFSRGVDYKGENVAPGAFATSDFRPAGVATFATGLLVAGLGATLLAVDLHRARKGGARRLGLQMTPTYVGIQIHQRF